MTWSLALNVETFLADNRDIILMAALGLPLGKISLKLTHASLRRPEVPGLATVGEILYHVVRCGLVHNAELDSSVKFGRSNEFGTLEGSRVVVPPEIVEGLLLAVIGCECNKDETLTGGSYALQFRQVDGTTDVDIQSLWGQKARLLELLQQTRAKRGP